MTSTNIPNKLHEEASKLISKARVALLTRKEYMFYSTAMMKLEITFNEKIPTAATNGMQLIFNPQFMIDLPHRQRIFVLMHELYHVIFKHVTRCGDRDPKVWNTATDYVINNELDTLGFDIWPNALLDHKYDGMSADQVYFLLEEQEKNNPGSLPQPDHDDLLPVVASDKFDVQVDKAIGEAMIRVQQERQGGKNIIVPDAVERYYQEMTAPKVNWREALQQFLFGAAKTDYSFAKPSRRSHALGVYLPSMYGQSMDCIDFAIDTSGSVSEDDFNQFRSELQTIFEVFQPENIGVIQFDDHIRSSRRVCNLEEFAEIQFQGGGGTNVYPVLQDFEESEGKALVFLTDGFFHHDESMKPSKPVIWAIYDNPNFVPAFGDVIHFNKDDLYDN